MSADNEFVPGEKFSLAAHGVTDTCAGTEYGYIFGDQVAYAFAGSVGYWMAEFNPSSMTLTRFITNDEIALPDSPDTARFTGLVNGRPRRVGSKVYVPLVYRSAEDDAAYPLTTVTVLDMATGAITYARNDRCGPALDPLVVRERLLPHLPAGVRVDYVPLNTEPDRSMRFHTQTEDGSYYKEYFTDAYSGELLGECRFGELDGPSSIFTFLYRLHYSLALDTVGETLLGVVALLWTLDCFVGAYLTFPPRARSAERRRTRSWIARWWRSWLLRTKTFPALLFTWHRASGLWVWGLLLVFAWSGVALNLRAVYTPTMRAVFGSSELKDTLPKLAQPRLQPALALDAALARGRELMAREAGARNIERIQERAIRYVPSQGLYRYLVRSSADVAKRWGTTAVWLEGESGKLVAFDAPTGQDAATTWGAWLVSLHYGDVAAGGLAYRLCVTTMGLLIALLSISSALIWLRKQRRHVVQDEQLAPTPREVVE